MPVSNRGCVLNGWGYGEARRLRLPPHSAHPPSFVSPILSRVAPSSTGSSPPRLTNPRPAATGCPPAQPLADPAQAGSAAGLDLGDDRLENPSGLISTFPESCRGCPLAHTRDQMMLRLTVPLAIPGDLGSQGSFGALRDQPGLQFSHSSHLLEHEPPSSAGRGC